MQVELRQWRYFLAVAAHGNVTRAAAELRLDQPALSRQIRRTERALGVELFARSPQGVSLSPAGQELLGPARRLVAAARDAEERAAQLARRQSGVTLVGTAEWYPYTAALGGAVASLSADDPPLTVRLVHIAWWDHLDAVVDRRVDAGFAVTTALADLGEPVTGELLRPDRVRHALLPLTHPLSRSAGVAAAELVDLPLFLAPADRQSYIQAGSVRVLTRVSGRQPRLAPTVGTFSQCTQSIAAGAGWTLVPDSVADHPPAGTTTRPLLDVAVDTGVYLVWRADSPSGPLTQLATRLREQVHLATAS